MLAKWRWNEIFSIVFFSFFLLLIQIHFHWLALQNQNLLKSINENGFGRFHVQNKFNFSFGKPIMIIFLLANFYLNINMGLTPFTLDVIKLSPQFTYRKTALRLFNTRIHFLGLDPSNFSKNPCKFGLRKILPFIFLVMKISPLENSCLFYLFGNYGCQEMRGVLKLLLALFHN